MRWPAWFPYPSSWLNSFFLGLLLVIISFFVRITVDLGDVVTTATDRPETWILSAIFFTIVTLLVPIPVITLIHHLVHIGLKQFFPSMQSQLIEEVGLFPGLMSWWEGLHGWMVLILSSLLTALVIIVALYILDPTYEQISSSESELENLQAILGLLWLTISAYFYQIEHIFQQRLVAEAIAVTNPAKKVSRK